jgi:pre-mRNA-splicing factor CWC26
MERGGSYNIGHSTGLQSAREFGENERKLKRIRDAEMMAIDEKQSGKDAQTVYRNKSGEKIDAMTEFMKKQSIDFAKKHKIEEAQYEWGKGSVQKKEIEDAAKEMALLANEPFARTADDPRREASLKEQIRDGDPMASYFSRQREKVSAIAETPTAGDSSVAAKPKYKGPAPAPNRMGIRPGYRWDAVDRGNGFEKRVMQKMNERSSLREDEYKWSVSDL